MPFRGHAICLQMPCAARLLTLFSRRAACCCHTLLRELPALPPCHVDVYSDVLMIRQRVLIMMRCAALRGARLFARYAPYVMPNMFGDGARAL